MNEFEGFDIAKAIFDHMETDPAPAVAKTIVVGRALGERGLDVELEHKKLTRANGQQDEAWMMRFYDGEDSCLLSSCGTTDWESLIEKHTTQGPGREMATVASLPGALTPGASYTSPLFPLDVLAHMNRLAPIVDAILAQLDLDAATPQVVAQVRHLPRL